MLLHLLFCVVSQGLPDVLGLNLWRWGGERSGDRVEHDLAFVVSEVIHPNQAPKHHQIRELVVVADERTQAGGYVASLPVPRPTGLFQYADQILVHPTRAAGYVDEVPCDDRDFGFYVVGLVSRALIESFQHRCCEATRGWLPTGVAPPHQLYQPFSIASRRDGMTLNEQRNFGGTHMVPW